MKKLLFYYCFILAVFISISGIITSKNINSLFFQLLFIPITLYFTYLVTRQFFNKKTKPVFSDLFNRGGLFVSILIFIFLLVLSMAKIAKKTSHRTYPVKNNPLPSVSIQPLTTRLRQGFDGQANHQSSSLEKEKLPAFITIKDEYKSDVINVRQSASSEAKILGIINTKEKYQVVSKNKQWLEINFKQGLNGFVHEKFIQPASF